MAKDVAALPAATQQPSVLASLPKVVQLASPVLPPRVPRLMLHKQIQAPHQIKAPQQTPVDNTVYTSTGGYGAAMSRHLNKSSWATSPRGSDGPNDDVAPVCARDPAPTHEPAPAPTHEPVLAPPPPPVLAPPVSTIDPLAKVTTNDPVIAPPASANKPFPTTESVPQDLVDLVLAPVPALVPALAPAPVSVPTIETIPAIETDPPKTLKANKARKVLFSM